MKIKYVDVNVWNGGVLMDHIIEFLKKEKPDVLVVQEAHNEQDTRLDKTFRTAKVLQEALGFRFAAFSPFYLLNKDGIKSDKGNAVFSNFSIRPVSTIFFDVPYKEVLRDLEDPTHTPRALQHVIVDVNGKELNVFNVHGIWGTKGEDNPRRLKMSETIIENVKDKKHVILSGDFNVNDYTSSIKNIGKVLHNVFDGERKSSFNMRQKPKDSGFASAVVDNIFVSDDIKVLSHSQPDVDISDHYPLIAELEI